MKEYIVTTLDLRSHQIKTEQSRRSFAGTQGKRHKQLAIFMSDRVEALKNMYEEIDVKLVRKATFVNTQDGRANQYGMFPADEDSICTPFDLPDFEERMPKPEDYNMEEIELSELDKIKRGMCRDS